MHKCVNVKTTLCSILGKPEINVTVLGSDIFQDDDPPEESTDLFIEIQPSTTETIEEIGDISGIYSDRKIGMQQHSHTLSKNVFVITHISFSASNLFRIRNN